MTEEWRDIKGFEGIYQVSNLGRIRSNDRYIRCKNNHFRLFHGKIFSPSLRNTHGNKAPYYHVMLKDAKRGIAKNYWVHRLVAETFIPNPDNLPCVNHKDENRLNNHANNLEWCSYQYNTNYGTNIERAKKTRQENSYIVSEETRRKLSLASRGRKHTDEARRKMSEHIKESWIRRKEKYGPSGGNHIGPR